MREKQSDWVQWAQLACSVVSGICVLGIFCVSILIACYVVPAVRDGNILITSMQAAANSLTTKQYTVLERMGRSADAQTPWDSARAAFVRLPDLLNLAELVMREGHELERDTVAARDESLRVARKFALDLLEGPLKLHLDEDGEDTPETPTQDGPIVGADTAPRTLMYPAVHVRELAAN